MGSVLSVNSNNDELVDSLKSSNRIVDDKIEAVFRAVDRGFYFLNGFKEMAYKDIAWKEGNLHLSAPCIYSEVIKLLDFQVGQSFLNLGSGTGYLNTLVGLLIGSKGINHGIEIHSDVVDYANSKLEQFNELDILDKWDFCKPKFIVGNCLKISPVRQYDRVYCGAECPNDYIGYLQSLLKIGGKLVVPLNENLVIITKISEEEYETKNDFTVSFAPLVLPDENQPIVTLPQINPYSLEDICRSKIKSMIKPDDKLSSFKAGSPEKRLLEYFHLVS